jgi:hypothetical protein
MTKLLRSLLIATLVTGCVSHARPSLPEAPDPVVGDLACAGAPMSLLDALYGNPAPAPTDCGR